MKRLPLVWRSENTENRKEKILKLGKVECSRIYCMRCLTPHLGSRLCRQKCEKKMQLNAIEYGQDLVTQHGEEQEEQNPQSTAM